MNVRHLVERGNVDEHGTIREPRRVRHGSLRAGAVWALAGEIGQDTHLNLDFSGHRLGACVVVERLAVGAPALMGTAGYWVVTTTPEACAHLGSVDVGRRRAAWLAVLRARRERVGNT